MIVNVFDHLVNFGAVPVVKTGGIVLESLVLSFADFIMEPSLGFVVLVFLFLSGFSIGGDLCGQALFDVVQVF